MVREGVRWRGMADSIVFLITDLELGGSPLMVRALARGVRDSGKFVPTVVSLASGGAVAEMLEAEGIQVIGLGARRGGTLTGWCGLPGLLRRWRAVLREVRPAIVQSVLVHANVVAALGQGFAGAGARGRVGGVVYLQSLQTLQERPRWHWRVSAWAARRCAAMVVPHAEILRRLERFGGARRGIVVANGIDVERFHNATPPSESPCEVGSRSDPARRVLGYVGRFDRVKRLDVLLKAAAEMMGRNTLLRKELQVVLVGYGAEERRLRRLAAELGIAERVHFVGATREPERWYKVFDVMCLPSLVEGFGLTAVEALASGVRLVAMDTPVMRDIVGKSGWLVSGASVSALSIVLEEVMLEFAAPKGGLEMVRGRFSEEAMVRAYLENLEKISDE